MAMRRAPTSASLILTSNGICCRAKRTHRNAKSGQFGSASSRSDGCSGSTVGSLTGGGISTKIRFTEWLAVTHAPRLQTISSMRPLPAMPVAKLVTKVAAAPVAGLPGSADQA